MSTTSKSLFEELKQRTVDCVNEPNYHSIESLKQFVQKCDHNFINSLYQYSIFPLRLIIAQMPKKGENDSLKVIESSVECLSLILQKSQINRFDIFADIYANLFHLIDDNRYDVNAINDKELSLKPSEDLILSVIKCSKSLIQSCDDCLLTQLVSHSFSAQLGHSIHILLNRANNQKYSLIKAEAIETIDCLLEKCRLSLTHECLKTCPRDLIAFFLPGISINISKLISSDDKLNRRVITSSLTLLSKTIVFVFEALPMDSEMKTIDSKLVLESKPKESENERFIAIRDQKWIENTFEKLIVIFEKIISNLISHQNWSVRQSLLTFVTQILSKSSPVFANKCLSHLIPVPLTYLSDDCEQITRESDLFVVEFSKSRVNSESANNYMELIEDQIYSHITRLARIVRIGSEAAKMTSIYLLFGYLKCLDVKGINYLLYCVQHKQKLFECLIDISCFDYHGIRLLELVGHSDKIEANLSAEQMPYKWIRKNFLYLNDEKSVTALTKCCQLIGQRVESQVLVDYLIEVLRQSKLNPSVVFISNQFIANINTDFEELEELLDLYLTNISTLLEDKTVEQMNKDILRQCLLIEGLTAFFHLYNTKTSHNYLMKCVFPLLECVGASHQCIYQTSYRALTLVSDHFGYNSISKLMAQNMDYLINSICINLKHFMDNQMVPIVIKVMLKYSTEDILHLFVDVIEDIIVVIDSYHLTQALPLMQVLYTFVCTLRHHFVQNIGVIDNQEFDCNQRTNCEKRSENLIKEFKEFLNNRRITQNLNESEVISDNEEECDVKEDEEKKVPFYIPLVEKIAERCVHILSNTDPKVRLIVLDIVVQCLHILQPFEDHLLPTAHKLWSPLVERFADKDVIVIKRSFSCLLIMSKTCGDFIRVRTVKEVIPKVLSFLRSQSRISFKKDRASAYRFTIAYQFQMDILLGIGSLAFNIELMDEDLWRVIVDIIPYLHTYQPIPLQESAIIALKKISELDSNSVFYYLKMTYNSNNTNPNEDNNPFPSLKFGNNSKEFAKNVSKVLKYLSFD